MGTNNTKQATWIAIGTFCSFLVGIISPMILSRFFDKADYGTYKQVMYVYNTLLSIFTLGLPRAYAYFIPKVPIEHTKNLINKITSLFFALGFMFSAFLFFCADPIALFLKNPDLSRALRLFSPVPMLLLPTMGLDGIYAAFRKTQYIAIYTIVTRCLTVCLTVVPVIWFDGNYFHAIIGFDIAALLSCAMALLMKTYPVRNELSESTDVSYKRIFAFSLPLLYASLWGTIIASANQFFISRYYGNEVFADFSNGFMELPFVGMIIGGVGAVLLPAFSKMDNGGDIANEASNLWKSTLDKSARIIFPMLIFCVFYADLLMICMYGDNYSTSAIYFRLKNLGSLLYIIPFAPVMIALGKVKEYARIHMIIAIVIVMAEYICVKTIDDAVAIALVSILCDWIKIAYMIHIIAVSISSPASQLFPMQKLLLILSASIIAGILSYIIIIQLQFNKFILLSVSLVCFIIIYYVLCFCLTISYRDIVKSFLPNIEHSSLIKIIP